MSTYKLYSSSNGNKGGVIMSDKGRGRIMSDKEVMLNSGLYLIKMADEGISTEMIKKAIEDLQNTIYARENVPMYELQQ